MIYTASVGVGSPATDYTLIIDTGSSNTWVGANKPYTPTGTSKNTGKAVVSFSSTYGRPLSSIISTRLSTTGLAHSLEQNVRVQLQAYSRVLSVDFGFSHRPSDPLSLAHCRSPKHWCCFLHPRLQ
jgi:Eukaryotic aspartyl protease